MDTGVSKDLWSILCNRAEPGSSALAVIQRYMDIGPCTWTRGPLALYEIQHDGIGRAADRRAELNRKINNPTAVKKWEDVPTALNAWETAALEYFYITNTEPDAETQMNSLLRMLPKSLYDIVATQYGITTYPR